MGTDQKGVTLRYGASTIRPPFRTAFAASLLLLLLILPAAVQAQYTYTTNNGTITITGYSGPGGAVTVPSTINGLPVTSIGYSAFYNCISLTSLTIPNTVTNIGNSAFSSCTALTRVMIPNSVTTIGNSAFERCISLTGICFDGNAPRVGSWVFDNFPLSSSSHATAFYLPGTAGWDSTFGGYIQFGSFQFIPGIPTAHWILPNPRILTIGSSLGVQTNQFGFIISWASNAYVAVEACTDLASPTWSPLQTNVLTGGSSYFSDPQWTNYPARFYRLRWP
jgi:hypothetical protein